MLGSQSNQGDGEALGNVRSTYARLKSLEFVRAADVVVTMGCGDACPIYPGKRYEDWQVADPAEASSLEEVRDIRDEIDTLVSACSPCSGCLSPSNVAEPTRRSREP
jgi:hypothetical protein